MADVGIGDYREAESVGGGTDGYGGYGRGGEEMASVNHDGVRITFAGERVMTSRSRDSAILEAGMSKSREQAGTPNFQTASGTAS
jgi:hypothetical protein